MRGARWDCGPEEAAATEEGIARASDLLCSEPRRVAAGVESAIDALDEEDAGSGASAQEEEDGERLLSSSLVGSLRAGPSTVTLRALTATKWERKHEMTAGHRHTR